MANVRMLGGHKEWAPTRKIDPRYSMDWMRDRVAKRLAAGPEEEMTPAEVTAAVRAALRDPDTWMSAGARDAYKRETGAEPKPHALRHLLEMDWGTGRDIRSRVIAIESLVAKLVAQEAADLSADEVRQIIEDAVVKVDVSVRDETEPS